MKYHEMPLKAAIEEYEPFLTYRCSWDQITKNIGETFLTYIKDHGFPEVAYIVPLDSPVPEYRTLEYMGEDEDNPFFLTPYFYVDMDNPVFVFCPCSVNGKSFTSQWKEIEKAIQRMQKEVKATTPQQ